MIFDGISSGRPAGGRVWVSEDMTGTGRRTFNIGPATSEDEEDEEDDDPSKSQEGRSTDVEERKSK